MGSDAVRCGAVQSRPVRFSVQCMSTGGSTETRSPLIAFGRALLDAGAPGAGSPGPRRRARRRMCL